MTKFADLHIHTYYSDGTLSPQETVQQALKADLACIAITDHDTVEGVAPTRAAAQDYDLEIITGTELSTEINGRDIHILGYFNGDLSQNFQEKLTKIQDVRMERLEKMIEKLKTLGVDNINVEEVCALMKSRAVGRPHLARILVEKGWVKSTKEAFQKYLADDRPAYVSKFKQTPQEAIALINENGGVAVMAHPMLTLKDELIPGFVKAGLKGMEVYYPNCAQGVIDYYAGLAKKHDLLMTGGSDAHGEAKKNTFIGKTRIPYDLVEDLKKAMGQVPR